MQLFTRSRFTPALAARPLLLPIFLLCAGCGQGGPGGNLPGDSDTQPYSGIAEDEELRVIGTEPFWGGDVTDNVFTYSTPENAGGTAIDVKRFAGRGGLSFSGTLDGSSLDMAVTEGECSDGMSDRTYPFTVTLQIGEATRNGCGWSESRPFSGGPA